MIVRIDKSFEKDVERIKDRNILKRIANCIVDVKDVDKLSEIKNIKKIKGFPKGYRIRLGDHRIGLIVEGGTVDFVRFLNRKDIYRYFPSDYSG